MNNPMHFLQQYPCFMSSAESFSGFTQKRARCLLLLRPTPLRSFHEFTKRAHMFNTCRGGEGWIRG